MQKVKVTAKDGAIINAVFHEVSNADKKGIVVICHGFGEHSGSYIQFAETLWEHGYASVMFDQRGHGEPPEGVKEHQHQGIIPSYRCFIDDVLCIKDSIRQSQPNVPLFLFGHSMGGNIAINTVLQRDSGTDKMFRSVALESPWLDLHKPLSPFLLCFARVLCAIAPKHVVSGGAYHKGISAQEGTGDEHQDDPLHHRNMSMRMLVGILASCKVALKRADTLKTPTFIAYADNETVVSNDAMIEFAKRAGIIVTLKEYNSDHTIHTGPSREQFIKDLVKFFDGHRA